MGSGCGCVGEGCRLMFTGRGGVVNMECKVKVGGGKVMLRD